MLSQSNNAQSKDHMTIRTPESQRRRAFKAVLIAIGLGNNHKPISWVQSAILSFVRHSCLPLLLQVCAGKILIF